MLSLDIVLLDSVQLSLVGLLSYPLGCRDRVRSTGETRRKLRIRLDGSDIFLFEILDSLSLLSAFFKKSIVFQVGNLLALRESSGASLLKSAFARFLKRFRI